MTIKDKLAHYEPKPLGEKGRYAKCSYLIYDVKKISIKSFTKYEVSIFLNQVRSLFQVGVSKTVRLSRSCYTRNFREGTKLNSLDQN